MKVGDRVRINKNLKPFAKDESYVVKRIYYDGAWRVEVEVDGKIHTALADIFETDTEHLENKMSQKDQDKNEFIKEIIRRAEQSPLYEQYMLAGRMLCHRVTLHIPPSFLEELKELVEEEVK